MTTENWIWVALAGATLVYYLVGRRIVARPRWELGRIWQNPIVLYLALLLPVLLFFLVIVAGLALTNQGWYYFAASLALFFLLAVKPRIGE
jgi:hypothetical protein